MKKSGCCPHCGGSGFRDVNNDYYEELCFWCGGSGKKEEKLPIKK